MKLKFYSLCLMILVLFCGIVSYFIYQQNTVIIPKVIHFVWLGSEELPENVQYAIETWKKYQPDFQIKLWNEKNCDVNSNPFIKEAYERKKYDYASDYCRVKALETGGVYLDTDMLMKAPLSPLLDEPLVLTLQRKDDLSASFIGVVPNHPFIIALRKDYESRTYFDEVDAPTTWGMSFSRVFSKVYIENERRKGLYHIYAPNILMYDFNGGENVAEHLFGFGSSEVKKSFWYNIFRKNYLKEWTLYFPKENKHFIFKNDKGGYFYDLKRDKAGKEKRYAFKYHLLSIFSFPIPKIYFCWKMTCFSLNK